MSLFLVTIVTIIVTNFTLNNEIITINTICLLRKIKVNSKLHTSPTDTILVRHCTSYTTQQHYNSMKYILKALKLDFIHYIIVAVGDKDVSRTVVV